MLIRFQLENYLSYNERVELSLVAGRVRQEKMKTHEVAVNKMRILKTAVLYGANASGKSNLIKGIRQAQKFIKYGMKPSVTDKYYRMDKSNETKPSIFVFEIEKNGVVYEYGFGVILNTVRLVGEWLYIRKPSGDDIIFDREISEGGYNTFKLGNIDGLESRFETYKEDFASNTNDFFLTEISKKNFAGKSSQCITPYTDVASFIKNDLVVLFPSSKYTAIDKVGDDVKMRGVFEDYLNTFHTGVDGLVSVKENIDTADLPDDFKEELNKNYNSEDESTRRFWIRGVDGYFEFRKDEGKLVITKLGLAHKTNSGDKVVFEIKDESDGTIRLLDFIPALYEMSASEKTFIIDEIDRSLHSLMTRKIVELFIQLSQGTKSQLIATTHEALLLDLELLRRDEIWFVEKKQHESRLYSLDQFKVRYDKDIHKSYLMGVYGAIPLFKLFKSHE